MAALPSSALPKMNITVNHSGFTLIDLLLVIAIIAILAEKAHRLNWMNNHRGESKTFAVIINIPIRSGTG